MVKNNAFGNVQQKANKNIRKLFLRCSRLHGSAGALTSAALVPTPKPAHNAKVSLEVASSEVTRIAATSVFLGVGQSEQAAPRK